MDTAVYWGCMIPTVEYSYELSLRATMPRLGINLVDLEAFSCCGSAVASMDLLTADYLALRNVSLAERTGLKFLLVPCNGCYLRMVEALSHWTTDMHLRQELKEPLDRENLTLNGSIQMFHTISFLHDVVGYEAIRAAVSRPLSGLKLASHTGCHLLRPSKLLKVDEAERPVKLDQLIRALGAEVVDYAEALDCCGAGLLLSNSESATSLSAAKLRAVQELSVDGLIDSCPSCHMMFDGKQEAGGRATGQTLSVPVLYYTQLLGLAFGMDQRALGLHLNRSRVDTVIEKISVLPQMG